RMMRPGVVRTPFGVWSRQSECDHRWSEPFFVGAIRESPAAMLVMASIPRARIPIANHGLFLNRGIRCDEAAANVSSIAISLRAVREPPLRGLHFAIRGFSGRDAG